MILIVRVVWEDAPCPDKVIRVTAARAAASRIN
jgi:hypothetical protein